MSWCSCFHYDTWSLLMNKLPCLLKVQNQIMATSFSWLLHPFPKFKSLQLLSSAHRIKTNFQGLGLWPHLVGSWIPLWPHTSLSQVLPHSLLSATLASFYSFLQPGARPCAMLFPILQPESHPVYYSQNLEHLSVPPSVHPSIHPSNHPFNSLLSIPFIT